MPRAVRLLTAKEVKAISKPGLTAVGGVTGLYLYIQLIKPADNNPKRSRKVFP